MSSSKRRSDVTTEIVVGAFMFTILVVLLTITVVISQSKLFQETYKIQATFPDVGGLKEGEGVFLRGVKIGNVEKIAIADDFQGVNVSMRLTRPVTLYEDYSLFVEPSSMLGGMRMVVDEGSHNLNEIPESQFDDLEGGATRDLMGEATELVEVIRTSLVEGGTLDNIKDLTANLKGITEKVAQGEGTVGRLIQDEGLYEEAMGLVNTLNQTATNLQQVAKDARSISSRLAAGEGSIGKLLSSDESFYNNFTNTLAQVSRASEDARKILARVEKGEGTIGKLLSADDKVYKDLEKTVANLRDFSDSMAQEKGTIGRLMNEDTLYVKVEALVDEARATIDDFRETSPITTFSSIFFGAF